MEKSLAKKYFVKNYRFLKSLLTNPMPQRLLTSRESRALILFLHNVVKGNIPVTSHAFQLLKKKIGLRKLNNELKMKEDVKRWIKSDREVQTKFLRQFRLLWKFLLPKLFSD